MVLLSSRTFANAGSRKEVMMTFFSSFFALMAERTFSSVPVSLSSMRILVLLSRKSSASSRVGIFSPFSVESSFISLSVRSATKPLPFVVLLTSASWMTMRWLSRVFLTSNSTASTPISKAFLKLRSVFSGS